MTINASHANDDHEHDSDLDRDDVDRSETTVDAMEVNPEAQPGIPDEPVSPAEGGD